MQTKNLFPFETKWNEPEFISILEKTTQMFNGSNKILDIGCGKGETTHYLTKKGFNTIGLELTNFNPERKKLWKLMPDTKFETYDGEEFPYQEQTFDGILLNNIFEHIREKDSFIAEVKRVLKSKGTVIFILPTVEWKMSKLHKIPGKVLLGLKQRNFKLMFGAWFVHASNIYGRNYLKEWWDWVNWEIIVGKYFFVVESLSLKGETQLLLKVRK